MKFTLLLHWRTFYSPTKYFSAICIFRQVGELFLDFAMCNNIYEFRRAAFSIWVIKLCSPCRQQLLETGVHISWREEPVEYSGHQIDVQPGQHKGMYQEQVIHMWYVSRVLIHNLKSLFSGAFPSRLLESLSAHQRRFLLSQLDTRELHCRPQQQVVLSEDHRTRRFTHTQNPALMRQVLPQRHPRPRLLGHGPATERPAQVCQCAPEMHQVQRCLSDPALSGGQRLP